MNIWEYQDAALDTAVYPNIGNNIIYPTLGLCGEAGEVSEKVKKIIRDKQGKVSTEDKFELAKELGDVLWYINSFAMELGFSLEDIMIMNITKLQSRQKRDKLSGSGDNR